MRDGPSPPRSSPLLSTLYPLVERSVGVTLCWRSPAILSVLRGRPRWFGMDSAIEIGFARLWWELNRPEPANSKRIALCASSECAFVAFHLRHPPGGVHPHRLSSSSTTPPSASSGPRRP